MNWNWFHHLLFFSQIMKCRDLKRIYTIPIDESLIESEIDKLRVCVSVGDREIENRMVLYMCGCHYVLYVFVCDTTWKTHTHTDWHDLPWCEGSQIPKLITQFIRCFAMNISVYHHHHHTMGQSIRLFGWLNTKRKKNTNTNSKWRGKR